MKFLSLTLLVIAILLLLWQININPRAQSGDADHYHAGFLVYIDGALQDYSNSQYMQPEVCGLKINENDNPINMVHLHNNVGDVVHVHIAGVKWRTLFSNLQQNFVQTPQVLGYRDGKYITNILDEIIQPNDSVIIVIGNQQGIDLNRYVSQEHINEVSAQQELLCGNS